jgi:hypothetical protein
MALWRCPTHGWVEAHGEAPTCQRAKRRIIAGEEVATTCGEPLAHRRRVTLRRSVGFRVGRWRLETELWRLLILLLVVLAFVAIVVFNIPGGGGGMD